jgi:hypothetical protein
MKMYVSPDVLVFPPAPRGLNPLDNKSRLLLVVVASAALEFGNKCKSASLNVFLFESNKFQFDEPLEHFVITKDGLNPVYTNGPSVDPFPVYDPNLLNPSTLWKQ